VRFIFQYPEVGGTDVDMLDAGPVAELAVAVERFGWNGFAFTEHPVPGAEWLHAGGHQSLDPLVALSHVAAVTKDIRLHTFLSVVPYHNAFLLAKAAATVDRLSNGRLVLGVGTGYLKREFIALGVDFDERNELFDEALDAMALHWSGEPFSFEGRHFNARDVIGRPAPLQKPIPIWIGGNSKLTLRRVASRGQGWMPMLGSEEFFKTTRTAQLATLDDLAGKIATLKEMAGARAAEIEIATLYSDEDLLRDEADVQRNKETFGRMAEIGISSVVVAPPHHSAAASLEFIEAFATTYRAS
jgi:probable F420-dependent oxidoreductase